MLRGVLNRLLGVLVPTAWIYILTWQVGPNFWHFLPLPDNLRTQHLRNLSWVLWGRKKKEGRGESFEKLFHTLSSQMMDHFQILLNCTLSGSETTGFVLFKGKGNRMEIKLQTRYYLCCGKLYLNLEAGLSDICKSPLSHDARFFHFLLGGNKRYSAFNSLESKSTHCSLGSDHL